MTFQQNPEMSGDKVIAAFLSSYTQNQKISTDLLPITITQDKSPKLALFAKIHDVTFEAKYSPWANL